MAAVIRSSSPVGRFACRASARQAVCQAASARTAWAVTSAALRSNGQQAPAAAERRPAAIAVLQLEQPFDAATGGQFEAVLFQLRIAMTQADERDQRAGRVVGFRHAARQIGPGPTARLSAGVRMRLVVLAVEQPIEAVLVERVGFDGRHAIGWPSEWRSTPMRIMRRIQPGRADGDRLARAVGDRFRSRCGRLVG